MKFEPLVKCESNKLINIADNSSISTDKVLVLKYEDIINGSAKVTDTKIIAISIPWSSIDLGDGNYNEEGLASLRDFLKSIEDKVYSFVIPVCDKTINDADEADSFISAFVHTARRIKDCTSIVGFAMAKDFLYKDKEGGLGPNSYCQWFINDMSKKHGHYVYFIEENIVKECGLMEEASKAPYILYEM